jgi:hypothetical protein
LMKAAGAVGGGVREVGIRRAHSTCVCLKPSYMCVSIGQLCVSIGPDHSHCTHMSRV